jgi:zinc/manganese transport system permease protein
MVEFLWAPLLACLVLTAIHVYLGLHVLARGVIFVDLALAQVAALGVTIAFLAGHAIQSDAAYWYALAFTLGGAALFGEPDPTSARAPRGDHRHRLRRVRRGRRARRRPGTPGW